MIRISTQEGTIHGIGKKELGKYIGTDGFVDVPRIVADRMEFELYPGLLPDVYEIRQRDFPLLDKSRRVYLDSTATSQEPQSVKDDMYLYRKNHLRGSNHSKNSKEAREYQERNEEARQKIREFFNADNYIVGFTGGTTDTSNYLATRFQFKKGDTLILTDMEHNSQILTARNCAEKAGIEIRYVPVSMPKGRLNVGFLKGAVSKKRKGKILLNLVHVSNVTGVVNPIKEIRDILGDRGLIYLDMAQSAGHMPIDLDDLDVDFAGISSHKMYGPMGIGAIFINKKSKKYIGNDISGGGAVDLVSKWSTAYADAPERFEPGTQDLEGAIEWGLATDFLKKIGMDKIEAHDKELGKYFMGELQKIKNIRIYGPKEFKDRNAVVSFNNSTMGRNHEGVAKELDEYGISVRDGCFCSHVYTSQLLGAPQSVQGIRTLLLKLGFPKGPLMIPGAVRASFAFYNTLGDAYSAVNAIEEITNKRKK